MTIGAEVYKAGMLAEPKKVITWCACVDASIMGGGADNDNVDVDGLAGTSWNA